MTKEFDNLITDAAPEVPDCGPSRRMTGLLLYDRMRRTERSKQWLRVPSAPVAASLVLLLLMGSLTVELGSDAFEFESGTTEYADGKWLPTQRAKIGSEVIDGSSAQEARDISEALASRQYTIESLMGLEVGGSTHWNLKVRTEINGKTERIGKDGDGVLPSSRTTKIHDEFGATPYFVEMLKAVHRATPPQSEGPAVIDGISVTLETWVFEFPGFGTVRYHIGDTADRTD